MNIFTRSSRAPRKVANDHHGGHEPQVKNHWCWANQKLARNVPDCLRLLGNV